VHRLAGAYSTSGDGHGFSTCQRTPWGGLLGATTNAASEKRPPRSAWPKATPHRGKAPSDQLAGAHRLGPASHGPERSIGPWSVCGSSGSGCFTGLITGLLLKADARQGNWPVAWRCGFGLPFVPQPNFEPEQGITARSFRANDRGPAPFRAGQPVSQARGKFANLAGPSAACGRQPGMEAKPRPWLLPWC